MKSKQNVFEPHYLKTEGRYVVSFGGTMSQDAAQAEVDRLNGKPEIKDITFEVIYQEGEYLSAYTIHGERANELEALGIARWVSGWGYKVDDRVVEALGTKFTHKAAVEYSQPARQAKLARARAEQEKRDAIFTQARETGKPVVLKRYSDDCDGSEAECSLDSVTVYAMPDGSTKESRIHTY